MVGRMNGWPLLFVKLYFLDQYLFRIYFGIFAAGNYLANSINIPRRTKKKWSPLSHTCIILKCYDLYVRWEWASQQQTGRGDFMYSRNGRKQNKMNNVKHNYVKIRVLSVLFRFRSKSHTFRRTFKNHVYDEWMTSNGNHGKTGVEMLPHSLSQEENRKLLSLLWKKWWYKMDFISLLAECDLRESLYFVF